MSESFLSVIKESNSLDNKIFSLVRILLLANFVKHSQDGILFRELQAALDIEDGLLYSNLKVLTKFGYLDESKVYVEDKELL